MLIGLDWDGTVCQVPVGTDMDNATQLLAVCTPRPGVVRRIREAAGLGHTFCVVTARGPHTAQATRAQLDAWLPDLSPHIQVRHRPRLVWDYRDWIPDKQRSLRDLKVDVYVGDHNEDRAAALRAGCRFLWDHEFELHGLVSLRSHGPCDCDGVGRCLKAVAA